MNHAIVDLLDTHPRTAVTHTIEVSGAAFILDRDGAEPYSAMVSCNGFAKEYRGNWAANEATQGTSRSPNGQAIPRALRCWIDEAET